VSDYEEIRIRDLEIGRITGEGIVRVNIELIRSEVTRRTIDHDYVENPWAFSVSGSVWRARNSPDCHSAGQIIDTVRRIKTPAVQELCRLWKRWHLNELRGACVHMTPSATYDPATAPVCPETGYRYGAAWLTEVIPDNEIATIREMVTALKEEK
jgi:hypothetical protein